MSPVQYRAGQAGAYGLWRAIKARDRLREAERRITDLERQRRY